MRTIQDAPAGHLGPAYARPSARDGLPEALCQLAATLLPRAERTRYLQEWRADVDHDPDRGLRYATSVLAHALTLRWTITGRYHPERPLRCQLGGHRYLVVHDNPENHRFRSHQCVRCGRVKDDWLGTPRTDDGLAWSAFSRGCGF
jgi:hypothetical protein